MKLLAVLVALAACSHSSPHGPDAAADGDAPAGDATPADAPVPIDAPCTTCTPLATAWEHHYGGADFGNTIEGIWVDAAGNTYVTGQFQGTIDLGGGDLVSAGSSDIVVASFAPDGTYRWAKRFGGTMGDQGTGITIANGKVYVAGTFTGDVDFGNGTVTGAGREDVLVLVLDAATGAYKTAYAFGTAGDDYALGVVVDASGNITIAGDFSAGTLAFGGGHSITGAASDNAFVVSFNASGVHRWSRTLAGSAPVPPATGTFNSAQAIVMDGAGNVTIAGEWMGTTDFGAGMVTSTAAANYEFDAFAASYTSTGTPRWSKSFGAGQGDQAQAAGIDASGNVLVGGLFHGTVNFGGSMLVQKGVVDGYALVLDAATGATKFARSIGDTKSSAIRGVRADSAGNVIVMGSMEAASTVLGNGVTLPSVGSGLEDLFVAGFDRANGNALFGKRYGGVGANTYASGYAFALSANDSMAIGGTLSGPVDLGNGPITTGTRDTGFAMLVTR